MARTILPDELWMIIEPLLSRGKPPNTRRRPPVPNRMALIGILFVLQTGIQWKLHPKELGCGCGMTCWRRFTLWQALGVWRRVHEALLAKLHSADQIDWDRAIVDSSSVRAVFGGTRLARTLPIGWFGAGECNRTQFELDFGRNDRSRMYALSMAGFVLAFLYSLLRIGG